jgi:hypothetical protein
LGSAINVIAIEARPVDEAAWQIAWQLELVLSAEW